AVKFLRASRRRYRRRRIVRRGLVFVVLLLVFAVAGVATVQYLSIGDMTAFIPQSIKDKVAQIDWAEEMRDYHGPPQDTLKTEVATNTPLSIPGGTKILTPDLSAMIKRDEQIVVVDALYDPHTSSIPGAVRIEYAGHPGTFADGHQYLLANVLKTLTGNKLDTKLVFFCMGMRCWESYNAALRAIHLGYTRVYWYRGGINAWTSARSPMENVTDRLQAIQNELRNASASDVGLRRR